MPARRVDILRAACCVASVDRTLDPREVQTLRALAAAARVGDASLDAILARALEDDDFLADQLRLLHTQPVAVIATLIEVAQADGSVTIDEHVLLRYFAGKLGLDEADFSRARQRATRARGERAD